MGGTFTEVTSLPIRGVHVSLSGGEATASVKYTARGRDEGLPWRPTCPDFAVGLEALCHHIPLGLVPEEVPEE